MSTYILLRNNKESGPLSLQDLLFQGLRPYDLIWVEGRSAAWRYPSEVEELKSYSEVVEEQPFDRFFKKENTPPDNSYLQKAAQATANANEATSGKQPVQVQDQQEAEKPSITPAFTPYEEKYIPPAAAAGNSRKSVFVTLPGQPGRPAATPSAPGTRSVPAARPIPVQQLADPGPVETEIKYSQSLNDIKDMYVQTLHDRKKRIQQQSQWHQYLRVAAIVMSLVGVGVLVGFMVRPRNAASPAVAQNRVTGAPVSEQPQQSVPAEEGKNIPALREEPMPAPVDKYKEPPMVTHSQAGISASQVQLLTGPLPGKTTHVAKSQPVSTDDAATRQLAKSVSLPATYQASQQDPHTGERGKATRGTSATADVKETNAGTSSANTVGRAATATDLLASQVTVHSNDYKRVAFGGIRDLRLTVTNNSGFELEQVVVELEYLKPSEQPLRTEQVQFSAIGANESATLRVPDTNRGIKVNYRIIKISSKQAQDAKR